MNKPVVFTAYCQRNTSESGRPGSSTRHVNLAHLSKEHAEPGAPAPNALLFEAPAGSANVQLNGITADIAASLPVGAKFTVTITQVEE